MPGPRRYSRHLYCLGFKDTEADGSEGPFQLSEREPFVFQQFADNVEHTVSDGETLFSLAATYFSALPRAAGLWWVIADFQPDPILDPTIALQAGAVLIIPSVRTVLEEVFNENRRLETGV